MTKIITSEEWAAALSRAVTWSSNKFEGRMDKAGRPYILHKLRVMNKVLHYGDDHGILGVCHDVIEDCYTNVAEGIHDFENVVIKDESLSADLLLLTRDRAMPYMRYVQNIAASVRATRCKKGDIEDNSDILRLKGVTEKDIARIRKYHAAYLYLNGDTGKLLETFA